MKIRFTMYSAMVGVAMHGAARGVDSADWIGYVIAGMVLAIILLSENIE